MNKDSRFIDYRLFDPSRSSLFKIKANERATFRRLYCSGWDRCQAYKEHYCPMWNLFPLKCPYGKIVGETGYTRRAGKFYGWIRSKRELVEGMTQLQQAPKRVFLVGDYIYFPYSYWNLAQSVPLEEKDRGGFFGSGIAFIPREQFTVDFFQAIVEARPHAMMGGEITSYQLEEVPKIVLHIEAWFPELFYEWEKKYPETAAKFVIRNHVGRSAIILTLPVGTKIPHKHGDMVWDGKRIIIDDYDSAFCPIRPGRTKLLVEPGTTATIKITNNDQVGPETKFID